MDALNQIKSLYRVLIVDDDPENREMMEDVLSVYFKTISAGNGEDAVRAVQQSPPDVIVMDVSMPRMNGLEACEILRRDPMSRHIPVIMVTGADNPDVRVQAFFNGADDFLAKPFKPRELYARVLSKIRRIEEHRSRDENLSCGNLSMDLERMEVSIAGKRIALSVLEFTLLRFFVQNRERVLTRDRILTGVWQNAVVSDRTVDTHIVSLRKRTSSWDHQITTVYGAGYILKQVEAADQRDDLDVL